MNKKTIFTVNVMSFGFKHGIPIDADLVLTSAFCQTLIISIICDRKLVLDEDVSKYVLKWNETQKFLEKVTDFLTFMLPHYKREGKASWSSPLAVQADSIVLLRLQNISANILKMIIIPIFPIGISKKREQTDMNEER